MKYSHILSEVMSTPWAIRQEKLSTIMSILVQRSYVTNDVDVEADPMAEQFMAAPKRLPFLVECDESLIGNDEPDLRILPVEAATERYEHEDFARVLSPDSGDAKAAAGETISRSSAPAIAVLPMFGTIGHRMNMFSDMSGGTSTERFQQYLRAALQDPSIKSIVIDTDSPGGTVNGVPELADEIFQGRSTKPIVAVANSMMASAAYFLGTQASELVVIPSGEVGSIGVFAAHEDISEAAAAKGVKVSLISAGKYKTEANPFEPLSADARAALQEKVNGYYDMFVNAVSRGRGATAEAVRNGFGQGRMLQADPARRAGMVDRIQTMDRTLKRLGAKPRMLSMPDRMKADAVVIPTAAIPDHAAKMARRRRELSLFE